MAACQSILQFLKEQDKGTEQCKQLYDNWKDGLDNRVAPFRNELDSWFMKCYSVICKNVPTDIEKHQRVEDVLKQEFDEAMNTSVLLIEADRVLQNMDFNAFVELVVECVDLEQKMIMDYNKRKAERSTLEHMNELIKEAQQLYQNLHENLKCFQALIVDNLNSKEKVQVSLNVTQFTTFCQNIRTMVADLYEHLKNLSLEMKTIIGKWLEALQLKHAELAVPYDLNNSLKNVKQVCGQIGKLIYDVCAMVQDEQFAKAVEILIGDDICQNFHDLFHDFLLSSFIITKQGSFYIKTTKKMIPEIELSVLAASFIPRREDVVVKAIFVSEDDITDGNIQNIGALDNNTWRLMSNTQTLKPGTSQCVFTFDKLRFKEGFKRNSGRDQKQVHEEKYRILFHMSFEQRTFVTWSLPFVVITASNQEAKALASIAWQCHSTNVFEFPVNIPEKRHWNDVADMLQLKMMKLSANRTLTEENLSHLKRKLFRKNHDEDSVTLEMLLRNSEKNSVEAEHKKKTRFSFWEWFLGVYNLIDQCLLPYWENGLILGFISKIDAVGKLENESVLFGTFILRFCDTKLDYKDGTKEVFGYLAAVIRIKEKNGMKRKLEPPNRKLFFKSVDVANSTDLKDGLAHILLTTRPSDGNHQALYSYVYPSNGSTKTLFGRLDTTVTAEETQEETTTDCGTVDEDPSDDESNEEINIGYVKTKVTKTVDIGSKFGKMNINDVAFENQTPDTKRARLDQNTPAFESHAIHHCSGCTCVPNQSPSAPQFTYGYMNDLQKAPMSCESHQPDLVSYSEPQFTPQTQFYIDQCIENNSDVITAQDMSGIASAELQNVAEMNKSLPEEMQFHVTGLAQHLSNDQQKQLVNWLTASNNGKEYVQHFSDNTSGESYLRNLSDEEIADGCRSPTSDQLGLFDESDFDFLNTP